MTESALTGRRLDSWKAIAQYLQRDVATVRRWEKLLGLPVQRVGLAGRSVFAYTREIDAWLSARPVRPLPDARTAPVAAAVDAPAGAPRAYRWRWLILTAGVIVAALGGLLVMNPPVKPVDLRFEVTNTALIARARGDVEQWRFTYPVTFDTAPLRQMVHLAGGARPGVYFATRVSGRREDQQMESGTLTLLDLRGRPVRSFSFSDQVQFDGESYGPPWALTAYAVNESGSDHRVAVAAHHYVWDPGIVTVLDNQWRRGGTFVNAGWIEAVRWVATNRLLIAGYSNAREGGMIALLDPDSLDGQGPEEVGSRHFCQKCGAHRPLRVFVFPRTELNRAASAPFNRVVLQTFADGRVVARTIELSSAGRAADALYEFTTPALDFVSGRFSDSYWEMHRELEAEGKIAHTRERCPDRDGPREMLAWEPATGWRTIRLR